MINLTPQLMQERKLSISVENLAPPNGSSLAPVWFGFHNGQFQTLEVGKKASAGLEQLAEDGSPAGITSEFAAAGKGIVQGALRGSLGGPFAPNDRIQTTVSIDPNAAGSQYFSYASMILPSNDQFLANADPKDVEIFNGQGRFLGAEFIINTTDAWDAGTEVNDELPSNTAFFGQTVPNTGTAENGVVTNSKGFNPRGSGGILDSTRFSNADFLAPGYQFAKVRVANLVEGGAGNDRLVGTEAPDDIFAGEGNNTVNARGGNDRVTSGGGQDTINTGKGNDVVNSGGGNDVIFSRGGDDVIDAGDGNDRINAGDGKDVITGGNGNDWISGGDGDDIINAGLGRDKVYGGYGSDTLVLNAGDGQARIFDYESVDKFSLGSGLTRDSISVKIQGENTILSSGSDVLAILQDIQTTQVTFV
jgi:Ca2+-binding RTX toxin-like protein